VPLLPKAFGIEHGLVELCFCEKTLLLWRSLRLEAIVLLFQLLKPFGPRGLWPPADSDNMAP